MKTKLNDALRTCKVHTESVAEKIAPIAAKKFEGLATRIYSMNCKRKVLRGK